MARKHPLGRFAVLLRPLAHLYGLGVGVRNMLFDRGILKSNEYPIPIICVGNITTGGTGKTPHIEYLLRLLTPHCKVALLSRGYKRKSRDLVVAEGGSTVFDLGDEPMQVWRKYPNITLVVDGNRRRGMRYLMSLSTEQRPDVVLMDDGYQHRYVSPACSILLIDHARPLWDDSLLPEGWLREPASARYRADIMICTKVPVPMAQMERRIIANKLRKHTHQSLFFSTMRYGQPQALGEDGGDVLPAHNPIWLISGIAHPGPFVSDMQRRYHIVRTDIYPDHHRFGDREVQMMVKELEGLLAKYPELRILCTEKDARRLEPHLGAFAEASMPPIYYIPIEVCILYDENRLIDMVAKLVGRKIR